MNDDDPIDLLARQLPALDVSPARAEAIRARAHLALAPKRPFARLYRRAELGLVGVVSLAYLAWAVQSIVLVRSGS